MVLRFSLPPIVSDRLCYTVQAGQRRWYTERKVRYDTVHIQYRGKERKKGKDIKKGGGQGKEEPSTTRNTNLPTERRITKEWMHIMLSMSSEFKLVNSEELFPIYL